MNQPCPRALGVLVLCFASHAGAITLMEQQQLTVDVGGDLKTFLTASFPYPHPVIPQDPVGQAVLDGRLKLQATAGDWLKVIIHPTATILAPSASNGFGLGASMAGGTGSLAEAVSLSRKVVDSKGLHLGLRVDRAAVMVHLANLDLTVGRQAVTFGSTFFFTPMDVVAPFSPVVVDRAYKPGVDAIRLDAYLGTSTRTTVVAAYAGSWNLKGSILAGRTSTTLGVVDIGIFTGMVRQDGVLGMDVTGDIMGTAIRSEATLTMRPGKEPYLRAALGMDRHFENGLSLMGELYVQTLGEERAKDYLRMTTRPQFQRGEMWAMGRYYGAVSATYELLPIINVGLSTIINMLDPSALCGPSMTWSVADEVEIVAGGYTAFGQRPRDEPTDDPNLPLAPRSEFGMYPHSAYVQFKAYF